MRQSLQRYHTSYHVRYYLLRLIETNNIIHAWYQSASLPSAVTDFRLRHSHTIITTNIFEINIMRIHRHRNSLIVNEYYSLYYYHHWYPLIDFVNHTLYDIISIDNRTYDIILINTPNELQKVNPYYCCPSSQINSADNTVQQRIILVFHQ